MHGILHRDMKPSNVLLDDDGNAYLMDFGIAKIVEATVDLTGDRLLGTPAYMSPEQCQGADIGPASDIYSLGIILYEMVTGRRPFHAETPVAVILQQLNDPLPPPHEIRVDLPPQAENVIYKALAKKPESRYKTASDLALAFNKAVSHAATAVGRTKPTFTPPVEPEPTTEPTAQPATMPAQKRRFPAWAWGVIGVLAATVLIVAGFFLANRAGSDDAGDGGETVVSTPIPPTAVAEQPEESQVAALPPPACAPGETELFFDDFESDGLQGWDFSNVAGQPSMEGWFTASQEENGVLIGSGHNWANARTALAQNMTLQLRLRAETAAENTFFHINFRMSEHGRYFLSTDEIHQEPDDVSLVPLNIRLDDQWHDVKIEARENHIKLYWDGRKIADLKDAVLLPEGGIALENIEGTVWYDDILFCRMAEQTSEAAQPEATESPTQEPAPEPEQTENALNFTFEESGQIIGRPTCGKSDVGDVNGDGFGDIFMAHGHMMEVWFNDGNTQFTTPSQANIADEGGNLCATEVALGDLDGDGDLDAVVGIFNNDQDNHENVVWINDGSGDFSDSGQRLGGSHSWAVALGDFDSDGDLDIFDSNTGPSKVWVNDGNGRFTDTNQSLGGGDSVSVDLGDLDSDGDLDAFVANFGGGEPNEVFLNDGNGNFINTGQQLGQSMSIGVALGDLDGDGDLDAFVANGFADVPNAVWLNDGNGRFTHSGQSIGENDSWAVALADFDGDGDLDAFIGNGKHTSGQANTIWLNDGSGFFTDSSIKFPIDPTFGIILTDLDNDTDLDAFLINETSNNIWLNQRIDE